MPSVFLRRTVYLTNLILRRHVCQDLPGFQNLEGLGLVSTRKQETIMNRTEIETRLLQSVKNMPLEGLQETLDFMEFIATKRFSTLAQNTDAWKQDFLSISQWDNDEVAVSAWTIELF
jgi:hypothetical protein